MSVLLPCPFCGSKAVQDGGWIFCVACGVGYEGEGALKLWNRRATETPITPHVPEVKRKLRAEIEACIETGGAIALFAEALEAIEALEKSRDLSARAANALNLACDVIQAGPRVFLEAERDALEWALEETERILPGALHREEVGARAATLRAMLGT